MNVRERLSAAAAELGALIEEIDPGPLEELASLLDAAPRVITVGAGRSGLVMRALAMRLRHVGIEAYVAGEVTTPPIGKGDLLVAASGSGETAGVVNAVSVARDAGARAAALTARADSSLAAAAAPVVRLPAWTKVDDAAGEATQPLGSLFEQACLLVADALAGEIAARRGLSREDLLARHANIE